MIYFYCNYLANMMLRYHARFSSNFMLHNYNYIGLYYFFAALYMPILKRLKLVLHIFANSGQFHPRMIMR